jgi:hypothetical protein
MLIERIEKKGRERWLTDETKSGEGVQKVDVGEALAVGDGDGVADVKQKRTESSRV